MANNIQIIGGRNVRVSNDAENLVLVNCSDQEFTSEDSNTINFKNGALKINDDGTTNINYAPTSEIKTADFAATTGVNIYFCDSTGGNIIVDIDASLTQVFTFIKTDATVNTVSITPVTGLIDGLVSYTLAAVRETITIVSDGTNFYLI